MTATSACIAARDFPLAQRSDYTTAHAQFQFPESKEFHRALDYFDVVPRGQRAAPEFFEADFADAEAPCAAQ